MPQPPKDDVVTVDRTDTPAGYRARRAALNTRIREAIEEAMAHPDAVLRARDT
jgi:hypothetical protein